MRSNERTTNIIIDRIADSYGHDIDQTYVARLKYDLVQKFVCPEDRILDVGCANGLHMRVLNTLCREIVGVDINDKMLELATAKFVDDDITNAHVKKMSATDLEFGDASFDLAYAFSVLLMVPDFKRAIEEIARVLKPGGFALLDVAGRYNLSQLYWNRFYRRQGHFGIHALAFSHIRNLLADCALELVEALASGRL